MNIQDLGSLGELIAAVATIATLGYLAVQVRQNTRALRSSTFQEISNDMSVSSQAVSATPDLAGIILRGSQSLENLSPEERLRFSFFLLMTFRRLESTFIQRRLGFIEPELTEGFERSVISTIAGGGGSEWWDMIKPAFSDSFVSYIDSRVATETFTRVHTGVGGSQ